MSYTDMQYTNPGWKNGAPPPVNASNLNDISNALQAVNITQQERTALGAQASDTLGQILEALKNAIDANIGSLQTEKGNCNIQVGSYVGNGQFDNNYAISLTFNFQPKTVIVFCSESFYTSTGSYTTPYAYSTVDMLLWQQGIVQNLVYNFYAGRSYDIYRHYSAIQNTLSWYITYEKGGNGNSDSNMNKNGVTYTWVAIG